MTAPDAPVCEHGIAMYAHCDKCDPMRKFMREQMAAGNHAIGVFKDGVLIAADDEVYTKPDAPKVATTPILDLDGICKEFAMSKFVSQGERADALMRALAAERRRAEHHKAAHQSIRGRDTTQHAMDMEARLSKALNDLATAQRELAEAKAELGLSQASAKVMADTLIQRNERAETAEASLRLAQEEGERLQNLLRLCRPDIAEAKSLVASESRRRFLEQLLDDIDAALTRKDG